MRVPLLFFLPLAFFILLSIAETAEYVPLFPMPAQGTSCMAHEFKDPGCPPPVLQDVARWERVTSALGLSGTVNPLDSMQRIPRKYYDVMGSLTSGGFAFGTDRTEEDDREALTFLLSVLFICMGLHVLTAFDLYATALVRGVLLRLAICVVSTCLSVTEVKG